MKKLPVKLTQDEVGQRARLLASSLDKLYTLEADRKLYSAKINQAVKEIRVTLGELNNTVKTGTELRDVECYEVPSAHRFTVDIIRCDTNEWAGSRKMTGDEIEDSATLKLALGNEK